jgi:hypothetical protein
MERHKWMEIRMERKRGNQGKEMLILAAKQGQFLLLQALMASQAGSPVDQTWIIPLQRNVGASWQYAGLGLDLQRRVLLYE